MPRQRIHQGRTVYVLSEDFPHRPVLPSQLVVLLRSAPPPGEGPLPDTAPFTAPAYSSLQVNSSQELMKKRALSHSCLMAFLVDCFIVTFIEVA